MKHTQPIPAERICVTIRPCPCDVVALSYSWNGLGLNVWKGFQWEKWVRGKLIICPAYQGSQADRGDCQVVHGRGSIAHGGFVAMPP